MSKLFLKKSDAPVFIALIKHRYEFKCHNRGSHDYNNQSEGPALSGYVTNPRMTFM